MHVAQLRGLEQVVAPAFEPVTLAEAKLHVRIDITADDDVVTGMIVAARKALEIATSRTFVTTTWDMFLDGFAPQIRIPRPKLVSVTSVKYTDTAGVQQTLSPSLYQVDTRKEPGSIVPEHGETWPTTRVSTPNAVEIRFVAGYGAPGDVPETIKLAIKMFVEDLYEHRGQQTEIKIEDNRTIAAIIWAEKTFDL